MVNTFGQQRQFLVIDDDQDAGVDSNLLRGTMDSCGQEGRVDQILTPRESDIAQGVYEGLSNKEIARLLQISPWTVSSHLRHVFAKLGITRRIELCRIWHQCARATRLNSGA
ncbi:MAG: helix-turn-helix transcriptional regulator [Erythrobacter sp.]|nr:helix-turn-helix transcriptional regulator [Erythrobacter sp.]